GQTAQHKIDLKTLAASGYAMNGAVTGDNAGNAVAFAGDLNGDGLGDTLVGAPRVDGGGGVDAGAAYLIYGQSASTAIQLAGIGGAFNPQGFAVFGARGGAVSGDRAGSSGAAAGDVNGDRVAGLAVGAPLTRNNGRVDSGSAYVIYGQSSPTQPGISLASVGTSGDAHGLRIDGAGAGDQLGTAVAGVPDSNGDGIPEVLAGAPMA